MKGILHKSKDGWMVKYTTYKTIPGIKGVMGSHSRIPESNYIPTHPDNALGLFIQDTDIKNEGLVVDFEIVEVIVPVEDGTTMYKCAKLINEEKSTKHSKQKKLTLSKETLDELFESHEPEDFIQDCVDKDFENRGINSLEINKDEELLIELEEWNHTCGDGCCHTYGTNIYINGEQIEDEDGTNPHQLLQAVLTKLGYTNVKVEYK